jgi:hypothetical protein
MEREFIYFKVFDKSWADMGLTDDDLWFLEKSIMENPQQGDVIVGTGGVRKTRFILPDNNKGKSGGARVLFVDFISYEKTVMLNAYPKGEKDTISDNEKKQLKRIVDGILKELRE